MLELLALLLPVAAASGWFAAAKHFRKSNRSQNNQIDQAYFQGMNHLLNEQHDKAIDSFIKLLEVDSSTVEIHFALGKLYRKQGEVERSIRIHQNLIARPSLDKSQKTRALFELGMDYVKAGLLDRAESLFEELSEGLEYRKESKEQLLIIYQDEKEWQKAIECINFFKKSAKLDWKSTLPHFYCELAIKAFSDGQQEDAFLSLKKALSIDSGCVRADLLLADFEFKNGQYEAALNCYKKAIKKDSAYLSEVLDSVMSCFDQLGLEMEKAEYLRKNSSINGGEKVVFTYAGEVSRENGAQKALDYLVDRVKEAPSINGLIELLETEHKAEKDKGQISSHILEISRQLKQVASYRCLECGYCAHELHWLCPACKRWAKFKRA